MSKKTWREPNREATAEELKMLQYNAQACDILFNGLCPEKFNKIKGSIELGSLIGSVLGLAILAPQVSHAFIHPALRMLGLEKPKEKLHNP